MLSYELRANIEQRLTVATQILRDVGVDTRINLETDNHQLWEVRHEIVARTHQFAATRRVESRLRFGGLAGWLDLPQLTEIFS